ncbi:MAG: Zn-dependent hydrolase, glyoxylase [Solidesulfovibrio magneticus str. Maddingley MBC34]|uniref:Zn-dependent hydrolase, glyoxylase n=1 Tax=Solidesulfovibrio magneticus str. Maddingley MBC34 TaxID=1206767 RepID=K6GLP1_9BACT|nr:MAG: Zn-dependent hydrolase, glyoxylase [Solidesulfovibrio magneticus str. Maddingley MBC34]
MNRRQFFMQAALATTVLCNIPGLAAAGPQAPPRTGTKRKQAGYYWFTIGDIDVLALSDGTLRSNAKLLNDKPGQVDALLRQAYVPDPRITSVNAYLIVLGDRRILVDAGTGALLGPALDKLPESLAAAGFMPGEITDILLTHIHADHSGGLSMQGRRVFPNATVHVSRAEKAFWLDPANMDKARDNHKPMFVKARESLEPYAAAGRLAAFEAGQTVVAGITSRPSTGHTPGHTFYVLDSQGQRLVFWGDTVHVAEAQFPCPELAIEYDIDPEAAVRARRQAFEEAVREGHLVAGAHIAFPGIGHVAKAGQGYQWLPAPYVNDAIC